MLLFTVLWKGLQEFTVCVCVCVRACVCVWIVCIITISILFDFCSDGNLSTLSLFYVLVNFSGKKVILPMPTELMLLKKLVLM